MDERIATAGAAIAGRAERELEALVAISSPSGDHDGAERALRLAAELLPSGAEIERPPCSTPGNAPDFLARLVGTGSRRLLLLGHIDTVIPHAAHAPLRPEGDRLLGPGTADMKGGDVLALGVARTLSQTPQRYAEIAVLLVTDEEWRTAPFAHMERFAGYDACLCFEAGERDGDGSEAVVVRRKAAGTLRIDAQGRASHSGSAPDRGRNALLALARASLAIAAHHDPQGEDRLSVVPTVVRSGQALNIVPAAGELLVDMRADALRAFARVLEDVPREIDGVKLAPAMERRWPGMDSRAATETLLQRAGGRLGRPLVGVDRGGASDASHFASSIPLTVDGLGPRGGGAHTPQEFILRDSLRERAEVALALAYAVLES